MSERLPSYEELLLLEYQEVNRKIAHTETIMSQYLNFFFIVIIAFGTLISTLFLSDTKCTKCTNNLTTSKTEILELFSISESKIFLILFASFIVFLVSMTILLASTKFAQVVDFRSKSLKYIRNKIYDTNSFDNTSSRKVLLFDKVSIFSQETYENDKITKVFLSAKNLPRIMCIVWIIFLLLFEVFIFCSIKPDKFIVYYIEAIALSLQISLFFWYLYYLLFKLENRIKKYIEKKVLPLKNEFIFQSLRVIIFIIIFFSIDCRSNFRWIFLIVSVLINIAIYMCFHGLREIFEDKNEEPNSLIHNQQ